MAKLFELESSRINDKPTGKRFLNSVYENSHSLDSGNKAEIEGRLLRQKRIW